MRLTLAAAGASPSLNSSSLIVRTTSEGGRCRFLQRKAISVDISGLICIGQESLMQKKQERIRGNELFSTCKWCRTSNWSLAEWGLNTSLSRLKEAESLYKEKRNRQGEGDGAGDDDDGDDNEVRLSSHLLSALSAVVRRRADKQSTQPASGGATSGFCCDNPIFSFFYRFWSSQSWTPPSINLHGPSVATIPPK